MAFDPNTATPVSGFDPSSAKPVEVPVAPAPEPQRGEAALAGVNKGIAGLAGLPVDTVQNILNLALAGYGAIRTAGGNPDAAPNLLQGSVGGSDYISKVLNRIGIGTQNPSPQDPASRMLNTAGTIVGGSMLPGAGVKNTLLAAGAGAVGGEALGPDWVGPASMYPAAHGQAYTGIKNAIASRTAQNVDTFKQAGSMPSVGQATDLTFLHGLENLAAKFPGGSGVMEKFTKNQQASIGASAKTGVATDVAGRAIERGIKGEGGFIERTRDQWLKLDQDLANKVGQYNIPPVKTIQALDDLVKPIAGAENTSAVLLNPKVAAIREQFMADVQNNMGAIPFDAARQLRSKVGAMLDDSLITGIPGGEMKKLYAALSKDMEVAADAVGAGKEFARQSNYYKARMDRVDSVLNRVIGKDSMPEDIFKRFMPKDPDQANQVRAVMRSLSESDRAIVSDAVVNRLGRSAPGRQNEAGDIFSTETFLTNWNKLSSGAKAQIFPSSSTRDNIEKIANAASTIREGKGIYANPSGTAGSFAAYSVYASPIASVATGSVAPLAAAAAASGSAYVGAKMLTNPKVVEWLATPVNPAKPGDAAFHLARLGVIYNNIDDPQTKQEIARFIQSAGANNGN